MTRRLLFPGLSGRVLGAVSAVRAALARAGGKVRVDKAAQEEALRLSLADAARRRVPAGGRHGHPPGDRPGGCRESTERIDRLKDLLDHLDRAIDLLDYLPASRRYERAAGLPGLAPDGRQREVHRSEPEIGR